MMAKAALQKLLTVLLLISVQWSCVQCDEPEQCVLQDDHCACVFKDNRKIDISQLFAHGKDLVESRFLEDGKNHGQDYYRFFFHGCKDAKFNAMDYNLDTNGTLEGSLIVYHSWLGVDDKKLSNLSVIGHADQIQYHVLDKEEPYELIYRNRTDGNVTASFRLICDHYEKPYIKIIEDPQRWQFTLNSPYACIVTVPEESSTGGTLLLIFSIACLIYFVGGGCFLYFARGARGAEIIPNIDFWRKLPGLVRDGTLFICGGCNATYISSTEAYDRI